MNIVFCNICYIIKNLINVFNFFDVTGIYNNSSTFFQNSLELPISLIYLMSVEKGRYSHYMLCNEF